ncbi:MAG: 30S ribosomal protein S11 [Patescibacteria group bacterium]
MTKDTTPTTGQEPTKDVDVVAATTETVPAPTVKRRKNKRSVPVGQVHIHASFNNTIVTFTDSKGGALANSSAGACGFRGSKKGTAYAAQVAMEKAGQLVKQQHGMGKVQVFVTGIGLGRDAAIRSIQGLDIHIESITDKTGVPHGGCRPPKARRV